MDVIGTFFIANSTIYFDIMMLEYLLNLRLRMKTYSQEWKMGLKLIELTKIKHEKSTRLKDGPNSFLNVFGEDIQIKDIKYKRFI